MLRLYPLGRHLAAYVDGGQNANPRRERIFANRVKGLNISNNEKNSLTHLRYQKKDKLFKIDYESQFQKFERFSEPRKYLEDQLEVSLKS